MIEINLLLYRIDWLHVLNYSMADLLGVKLLVLVCLLGPDFPVYCSSAITTKSGSPSHSELEGHDLHRVRCDKIQFICTLLCN